MIQKTLRKFCFLAVLLVCCLPLTVQAQDTTRLEQGVAFLEANQIPSEAYVELSAMLGTNDPQQIAEVLVKYGYSPEQLEVFMTEQNLFALSNTLNPGPTDALLNQALTILTAYDLTLTDLEMLVPLVNDPMALMKALLDKGLTQTQVVELLQQIAPLIQEAADSGLMQYIAMNGQLEAIFNQAGIPTNMLFDSAHLLNEPEAAAAYLAEIGYTEQEIQTYVELIPTLKEQGVTIGVVEGWSITTMIYRLEGIGLSPQTIKEILGLGNLDAVRGYLTAQGMSGSALELALVHIAGVMGFYGEALNVERLEAFQIREAFTVLNSIGIDPADLGEILALSSDPAALSAFLSENYARDAREIAVFIERLSQSTFVRTVDPNNSADFVASVIAFAESSG